MDLTLKEMIAKLDIMRQPAPNDTRTAAYCKYINTFLSHFGNERCQIVGSTRERLRLRMNQDEGDFDYLVISWLEIPVECLHLRPDLPCVVHVLGKCLEDQGIKLDLIDRVYLPASTLRMVHEKFFPISKGFVELFSNRQSDTGYNGLRLSKRMTIKPGISHTRYKGFECKELSDIPTIRQGDIAQIQNVVSQAIKEFPDPRQMNNTLESLSNVLTIINGLRSGETSNAILYQNYGDVLQGIGSCLSTKDKGKECNSVLNSNMKTLTTSEFKTGGNVDVSDKSRKLADVSKDDCYQAENVLPDKHLNRSNVLSCVDRTDPPMKPQTTDKTITVRYNCKVSDDFIPAFKLSQTPEFILDWSNRTRKWPKAEHVKRIIKCSYYIVAKPAIKDCDMRKDFCLACNEAEIILAESMFPLQQYCMLIVKAYQKSALRKYSDHVTTFHWKTVLYRVSENMEELETWQDSEIEEHVTEFLERVINFMMICLQHKTLHHFFVESNLFAGLDSDIANKIIEILHQIKTDYTGTLMNFFLSLDDKKPKTEKFLLSEIIDIKSSLMDESKKMGLNSMMTLIFGIARHTKDKSQLNAAITDVLVQMMADMNSNRSCQRREDDGNCSEDNFFLFDQLISYLTTEPQPADNQETNKLIRQLTKFLKSNRL